MCTTTHHTLVTNYTDRMECHFRSNIVSGVYLCSVWLRRFHGPCKNKKYKKEAGVY